MTFLEQKPRGPRVSRLNIQRETSKPMPGGCYNLGDLLAVPKLNKTTQESCYPEVELGLLATGLAVVAPSIAWTFTGRMMASTACTMPCTGRTLKCFTMVG
jgi:hypothetical protein